VELIPQSQPDRSSVDLIDNKRSSNADEQLCSCLEMLSQDFVNESSIGCEIQTRKAG
jgi:hypothetical protein